MLIAMLYVAECFTFGKEPDLSSFNVDNHRKHIVDVILGLVNFH